MKDIVKHYIELALREKIKRERPDYGSSTTEKVVAASMGLTGPHVTKDVLYRAIELAATTSGQHYYYPAGDTGRN